MDATVKLFTMSVDFASDFILTVLKINSKIMGNLMKYAIYICQQLLCIAAAVFKGIVCALNDLIAFLLEFGHWILVIVETICSCIAFLLRIISHVYEAFFCGIFTLCSFILSVCSSLREQVIFLAGTLYDIVSLVVSSCLLVMRSVPKFTTLLFKTTIVFMIESSKNAINSICYGSGYIRDSLYYFMNTTYTTVCDIPTDFYIGIVFLFVICAIIRRMWQTYQRNGIPQFILMPPRVFIIMICGLLRKFSLCTQRILSLFSFSEIIEDDNESSDSDVEEHIVDTDNQEENIPSSSCNLRRKPLVSLRERQTDNSEESEIPARILMKQLERERDHKLCVVCQDKTKNIILLPCRHLCMCSSCYRNIVLSTNICPLCRHEIYDYMQVFF